MLKIKGYNQQSTIYGRKVYHELKDSGLFQPAGQVTYPQTKNIYLNIKYIYDHDLLASGIVERVKLTFGLKVQHVFRVHRPHCIILTNNYINYHTVVFHSFKSAKYVKICNIGLSSQQNF